MQSLALQFAFKEAVTEAMAKSGRRGQAQIKANIDYYLPMPDGPPDHDRAWV